MVSAKIIWWLKKSLYLCNMKQLVVLFLFALSNACLATVPVVGIWESLGTSITWYNDNVEVSQGCFQKGYQTQLKEKYLAFDGFVNGGINGGRVGDGRKTLVYADFYTIEYGINDWGKGTPLGRFEDYVNNTDNGTFAANYRLLIDSIRSINPAAKVILCTPRKSFGFNGYLPEKWNEIHKGTYLLEFVEMIFDIAEYEGFVVADFFHECGTQENLVSLSIEECKGQTGALHPNDEGFALMAKTLYHAFMKLLYQ